MKTAIGLLLAAYLFFALPFLLGALWDTVIGISERRLARAYANGYIVMFAVFLGVAVPLLFKGYTVKRLSGVWFLAALALGLVSVVVNRGGLVEYIKRNAAFYRGSCKTTKIMLAFAAAVLFLSVLFVTPQEEDTVETVVTAVETDTAYQYQPYTGERYEEISQRRIFSSYAMIYAAAAEICALKPTFLIKLVLPSFLISFFYCCYWELGRTFFREEKKTAVFLIFVIVLYMTPVYTAADNPVSGVFRSCWNGEVLLNSCVFPLIFSKCVRGMHYFDGKRAETVKQREVTRPVVGMLGMAALSCVAAQLLDYAGGMETALMILVTAVVILARKGYAYVSALDRH